MLRVMLIDDANKDLSALKEALSEAGCSIVAEESSAMRIPACVSESEPDLIIIESESPTRDVLEQLCVVTQFAPRPIVMFTQESDQQQIHAAMRAGVTAYIVAGMRSERIRPILDVAIARFEQDTALRAELEDAKTRLAQRKLIEKAKGLLMAQRRCSEEEAYRSLRKLAMDRNLKLVEVAQQVIDVARLMG
jgi:response regulator NasT